jgi:hypothetical protein
MLDLIMFFPLMKTPNLEGFLDLIYQAPNNWENRMRKKIYMHLIWYARSVGIEDTKAPLESRVKSAKPQNGREILYGSREEIADLISTGLIKN